MTTKGQSFDSFPILTVSSIFVVMIRLLPIVLYLIGGFTLRNGSVAAQSSHTASSSVDVDNRRLPSRGNEPKIATVTIGTNKYTINPTSIVLSSQTFVPGGPPVAVNGNPISEDVFHDLIATGSTVYEFRWSNTSTHTPMLKTKPIESAATTTLTSNTVISVSGHSHYNGSDLTRTSRHTSPGRFPSASGSALRSPMPPPGTGTGAPNASLVPFNRTIAVLSTFSSPVSVHSFSRHAPSGIVSISSNLNPGASPTSNPPNVTLPLTSFPFSGITKIALNSSVITSISSTTRHPLSRVSPSSHSPFSTVSIRSSIGASLSPTSSLPNTTFTLTTLPSAGTARHVHNSSIHASTISTLSLPISGFLPISHVPSATVTISPNITFSTVTPAFSVFSLSSKSPFRIITGSANISSGGSPTLVSSDTGISVTSTLTYGSAIGSNTSTVFPTTMSLSMFSFSSPPTTGTFALETSLAVNSTSLPTGSALSISSFPSTSPGSRNTSIPLSSPSSLSVVSSSSLAPIVTSNTASNLSTLIASSTISLIPSLSSSISTTVIALDTSTVATSGGSLNTTAAPLPTTSSTRSTITAPPTTTSSSPSTRSTDTSSDNGPGGPGLVPIPIPPFPPIDGPAGGSGGQGGRGKSVASTPNSADPSTTSTPMMSSSGSSTMDSSSSSLSSSTTSSCNISATLCSDCFSWDFNPTATPNPLNVDDETQDKRAIAGRIWLQDRELQKRARVEKTNSVGGRQCSVAQYTIKPKYPGPNEIASNEAQPTALMAPFYQTATYWAVPTHGVGCAVPGWEFKNSADALAGGWGFGTKGSKGQSLNVDHVYEVSLLDEFFGDQIAAGFTCANVTRLFDVPDGANSGTRLNSIFGQLASYENPDFLGMDTKYNSFKGSLWNPGLQGLQTYQSGPQYLLALSYLAIVMSMNQDVKVMSLFENTNTRIYQAFQGIDVLIEDEARCSKSLTPAAGDPMSATWASAYSTWITNKIASQNNEISKTASSWSAAIPTVPPTATGKKIQPVAQWSSALVSLTEKFPMASLTFKMPTWPVGTPLGIHRRQDACSISSKASLSISAVPSTTTGLPVSTDAGPKIRPHISASVIHGKAAPKSRKTTFLTDMAPHPTVTSVTPTETTPIDSTGVVMNSPSRVSIDVSHTPILDPTITASRISMDASHTPILGPTIAPDPTANATRPWPIETVPTDTTAVGPFKFGPISSGTLTITATFGPEAERD